MKSITLGAFAVFAILAAPQILASNEGTTNSAKSKIEQKSFPADSITAVEVRNTSGDIIVSEANGATATIIATKKEFAKSCTLSMEVKDSLLKVVVSRNPGSFFGSCNVELQITVAATSSLDIRTGAGDISAKGINGGITFRTGSGDVELQGKFPKIDGKSGSGDIVAYALTAEDVAISTGSGDIKVTFIKTPELGRVDLKTGSGDTIVTVPKGSKLKSSLLNGMGDVIKDIGDTPGAKFDISARSGSGDLSLKQAM